MRQCSCHASLNLPTRCAQVCMLCLPCSRRAALFGPCVVSLLSPRVSLCVPCGATMTTRCSPTRTHFVFLFFLCSFFLPCRAACVLRTMLLVPCGATVRTRCRAYRQTRICCLVLAMLRCSCLACYCSIMFLSVPRCSCLTVLRCLHGAHTKPRIALPCF